MTGPRRTPTDGIPVRDEPPWRIVARITSFLLGLPALLFSFFLLILAVATSANESREPRGFENSLQLLLGGLSAFALFASAVLALLYFRDGRDGRRLVLMVLVTAGVVLAWRIGFSTWCTDCGASG